MKNKKTEIHQNYDEINFSTSQFYKYKEIKLNYLSYLRPNDDILFLNICLHINNIWVVRAA